MLRHHIPFSAVLILLACSRAEPIRIAVVGVDGSQLGAVLAVEDVNASGGVDGRLVELSVIEEPQAARTRDALAAAESLAADASVLAVIGHGGSGTSLAASQVYNTRGVPQIAPNSSSPLYTNAGPFSFRLVASDEHQANFINARLAALSPAPRVGMLYVNDDYGRALHESLHAGLAKRGVTPVYDAPFLQGESFAQNLDALVRSVTAARPDVLVWIGLTDELRLLRPRLRSALPRLRVLGSDGVSLIAASAGASAFEGDWVVSYTDITSDRPALREVARRYAPRAGRDLTDGAALTYDAMAVVAEALRAGARTRGAIKDFLEGAARDGRTFQGITGPITFDEHGDAKPSYVLFEIHAGGMKRTGP